MRTLALLLILAGPAFAAPSARVLIGTPRPALRVTHRVVPGYPKEARMAFLEGDVLLTARVSGAGLVDQVEAVSGPAPLAQAARAAVRDWRFASSGRTERVAIPVQFRMDLDLSLLLDRAAGLVVERRAGDSTVATFEVADPAARARIAGALLAKGLLHDDRRAGPPRGAAWAMRWRTQGRIVSVFVAGRSVVVRDEERGWAGNDRRRVEALAEDLEAMLPR